MNVVKEKAYAKINLYLDILSRREDGFHDIRTVMHTVSLADEVTVSSVPATKLSVKLSLEGATRTFVPCDEKNLAIKAALAFFEKYNSSANITIKLKKNIPVGAGLAGGSTDAAAVLRALNKIYKKPFTEKALAEIGAEIGSDVPFCVLGKTALCHGRGEDIHHIDKKLGLNIVIANSGEFVSTPQAYSTMDIIYSDFDGSVPCEGREKFNIFTDALENGGNILNGFYNIFEGAVLEACPKALALKEELLSGGAEFAMMSGSGPSVFGVFESKEKAIEVAEELAAKGAFACYAASVE